MKKQLQTIPKFTNEAQERAFWEANDSSDRMVESQEGDLAKFEANDQDDFVLTA